MLISRIDNRIKELRRWSYELSDKARPENFKTDKMSLKDLKVACIMDQFTLDCYSPECELIELTPSGWEKEIESFKPDMLFLESAWLGKESMWHTQVVNCSDILSAMIEHCRKNKIPVVFWNKEDPAFTNSFMATARLADYIFTTDVDCLSIYKKNLATNNVYHLHFAAQPKIHNPEELFKRKDKYCFAGAYYHRYKERSIVFDKFSDIFINTKGFDIFDRNYKDPKPEYDFPERYKSHILGTLKGVEIVKAYKGYHYGINMNSINQSQSMFARRVFELLASNTVVISNYSRGLKNYFGDLLISTNSDTTLIQYIDAYCSDEHTIAKYKLLGLREVFRNHLYEDRLGYITEKVFGKNMKRQAPSVLVIAKVATNDELEHITKVFNSQTYENKKLLIFTDLSGDLHDIVIRDLEDTKESVTPNDIEHIAVFNPNDYYAENYLTDLMLMTRYEDFDVIGKAAYLSKDDGIKYNNLSNAYKRHNIFLTRRAIFKKELISNLKYIDILDDGCVIETDNGFSANYFGYCENGAESCTEADDLFIPDHGIPLKDINERCGSITSAPFSLDEVVFKPEQIYKETGNGSNNVKISLFSKEYILIEGKLPEDKYEYIFFNDMHKIKDYQKDDTLLITFHGVGSSNIIYGVIFYNSTKEKLNHVSIYVNQNASITLPEEAVYFKFCIRVKGITSGKFKNITTGETKSNLNPLIDNEKVLIITNHYPDSNNLYNNMFIHRRTKGYNQAGLSSEIAQIRNNNSWLFREFEGSNVIEGDNYVLSALLESDEKTVCLHFMNQDYWNVLKQNIQNMSLIIWIHGAEIQPWWRRKFNYETEGDLKSAKRQSDIRMSTWNEIFEYSKTYDIHFVFVSQYFANEVMEDYNIQLDNNTYSIIHNFIDTELFNYIPKPIEQRTKILSIKSYASAKYANDITTNAILELSKTSEFNELEFHLYGDGKDFERFYDQLKDFRNVHIYKRFLTQTEIADLHKEFGVFLATTRWDSHGVSRDEAMSSGLIPITNAVSAIPEFVDDSCGILVPGEDHHAVADAILKLYYDPKLFTELSYNASQRVRRQSSLEKTIHKEIELIKTTINKRMHNGQ